MPLFFDMDELRLINLCVNKSKPAWDAFVRRYSRLIYNYIYSVLKVKGYHPNPANTSDIYQGIFLSLIDDDFRKLRSFQGKNNCSLSSWLRVVTINFTLDHLRKNKRPALSLDTDRAVDTQDGLALKDTLFDEKASADTLAMDSQMRDELSDCIQRLAAHERYLVHMHIYRGVNMDDLVKLSKYSRGSLEMRKARIIEKLKDCFRRKKIMLDY